MDMVLLDAHIFLFFKSASLRSRERRRAKNKGNYVEAVYITDVGLNAGHAHEKVR
jgi:hypothetical protein